MRESVSIDAIEGESFTFGSAGVWQERVAAKQAAAEAAIPPGWRLSAATLAGIKLSPNSTTDLTKTDILRKCGILSERELGLTEKYNARQLLWKMAAGEVTSSEVTLAFSKRAAVAQQLLSCLTETLFPEAQARAAFLDDYLKKHSKVFGPLHGLPISLKDSFDIAGVQSTLGYVSFLGRPIPTVNAALVDVLLGLGAILYVKTNIPQTLMTADSENIIFGRTLNPKNLGLTAGGSSGGEGALIAFRGSILGVGTDIAGSIRIPSSCCGVYGFKPTTNRIPYGGQTSPALSGMPGIVPSAGPLATNIGDLELFVKSIIDAKPWVRDSSVDAVPWFELPPPAVPSYTTKFLTIGVLEEDPELPLHPPVKRALAKAVAALTAAGHTLIPVHQSRSTSTSSGWLQAFKLFSLDPTNTSIQHILDGGEPIINTVKIGQDRARAEGPTKEFSLLDLAAMNVERAKYREAWRELWNEHSLDVLIGPSAQHTAPKHDTHGMPGYTVIWNLLDYPACIIPYSTASMELDPDPNGYPSTGPPPAYDPKAFDGAPCAIQVVAPRFQDEQCLFASRIIDDVLNG
ncbi:amidase [Hyaloscypha variabilis]